MLKNFLFMLGLMLLIGAVLASEVDLRSEMPPIKGQGKRGTCSVFAATSIMEFLLKKNTGYYINLSEEYNYWIAKKYTLTNSLLKTYESVDALAGYLALEGYKFGAALESDFPYQPNNRFQLSDPTCTIVDGSYVNRCFSYEPSDTVPVKKYKVDTQYIERENIGQFIIKNKKPVLINILWCYDVINQATGRISMPSEEDLHNCGGHVITLVGYNENNNEFIFRNSWGESWGDHGYGYIPEQYINQHCETCSQLSHLEDYLENAQELYIKASKGISADLIDFF